ncbi:hypothetical protein [Paracoccus niistensis]|uniref:Glycosyltransferase RgtA/B/C/D-like domain-containing protein n=1 Tax=Paracoccus niistensis TaxID=632935 RepID=A0ABV6I6C0_9RHOB
MSVTDLPVTRSLPRQAALAALAIAGLLILGAALYGRIMGFDLRRDEWMFVPPAATLGDWPLYSGQFYNHVPYSAWAFRAVHLMLPGLDLLTSARLTVFAAWILLMGGGFWAGCRITGSPVTGLFAAAIPLASETLLSQAGMAATNNLLPLPFILLGLALFAMAHLSGRSPFVLYFAAGLSLSVAAGMKASAIAFVPAVVAACFMLPRGVPLARRARLTALPVALGGLVGALPLIWLALTEPTFFDHILRYHSGPHVAYWQANAASEPGLAMGLPGKVQLAQGVWLAGGAILGLFVAATAWAMWPRSCGRDDDAARAVQAAAVVGAAMGTAAALAFVPTPAFPQYFVQPLAGLPVLAALAIRALPPAPRTFLLRALPAAVVLMGAVALPRLATGLVDLRHPDRLTPARLSHGAEALARLAAPDGLAAGPVATLSPLYPLQAGLPIYPEFATGPFAWRVAGHIDPALRASYVMAGPEDLARLFGTRPPVAILTGFDPALEAPLEDYARAHGYRPRAIPEIHDRYGTGTLWLPAGSTQNNPGGTP